ncbi:MAG: hypothetical protein KF861_21285 [Planctomycetaceae bacterium]|nr:hypothetical protein [Planctomycetaceae bacterium]
MIAKLKSVRPFLVDENEELYEFDVDLDVMGEIQTVRHISAERLLDAQRFAVAVAENLGLLIQEERHWRRALAGAWQTPEAKPDWADEEGEAFDEDSEEMVLADDSPQSFRR